MINYIILAHKNPEQVKRLVEKLDNRTSYFYIHIDKNTSINPFVALLSESKNIIFVKKRETSIWADVGIVKATLSCMQQIVVDKRRGYCVLLSGQDYPVKSRIQVEAFLAQNYGQEFIEVTALPIDGLTQRGMDRIESYKINLSNKRGRLALCASVFQLRFYSFQTMKNIVKLALANKLHLFFKVFKKRKFPNYIEPYFGSQWWALTIETVTQILDYVEQNPSYLEYHKYTFVPDEIFFQSIVASLFKDRLHLLKNSLTFVDWGRENNSGDAPTLFLEDYELLINQPKEKLFARKFDSDDSILDELDRFTI